MRWSKRAGATLDIPMCRRIARGMLSVTRYAIQLVDSWEMADNGRIR
jgi:hypothetical protein